MRPAALPILVAAALAQVQSPAGPIATSTVGVEGRLLYRDTSGQPLRPAPADDRAPVIVRIAAEGQDGDAILYDLRFIAQYSGRFDLRNHLVRPDGTPLAGSAPALVEVSALLPATNRGDLYELPTPGPPRLGGYRVGLVALGIAWLAVPVYFISRRLLRPCSSLPLPPKQPATLADHLRLLVERAMAGDLPTPDRARLERLLLGYWQDRLGLAGRSPIDALAELRRHRQAGELLAAMEQWLHRPPHASHVDVTSLLGPYRHAAALISTPIGGTA